MWTTARSLRSSRTLKPCASKLGASFEPDIRISAPPSVYRYKPVFVIVGGLISALTTALLGEPRRVIPVLTISAVPEHLSSSPTRSHVRRRSDHICAVMIDDGARALGDGNARAGRPLDR